jgi:hypothetical protein
MKTRPPRVQIPNPTTEPDFDDESGFYSDVYYPDLLPGESETAYCMRITLQSHGYATGTILAAETHPVWVIRVKRKEAPRIADQRLFARHIQELLQEAGFRLNRSELTIDRQGDAILITFPCQNPIIDYAAGLHQAEQDAAEFADMAL